MTWKPGEDNRMMSDALEAVTAASNSMDKVADDCKFKKGESLYDRIEKCSRRMNEWSVNLNSLKKYVDEVEKESALLMKLWPNIPPGPEPGQYDRTKVRMFAAAAKVVRDQHTRMKSLYDSTLKELKKHKASLRHIKA